MISYAKQHDLDLWEAWIEYDQFGDRYFGTLYVIGEVASDLKHDDAVQHSMSMVRGRRVLVLRVPKKTKRRSRLRELRYSEPIARLDQYDAIYVYAGNELIARFDEIEVMV